MRRSWLALMLFLPIAVVGIPEVAAQTGTTVYIVRHAEKADAPANDPPLSADGAARAQALREVLADARISAIISTPTVRTRTTAVPLAEALGVPIETVAVQGSIAAHAAEVAAAVRAKAGGSVLVVGHSNTVNRIATALGGPAIADLCDGDYDQLFILQLVDGGPPRFARVRFGAPTPDRRCVEMKSH
jgi:broad specificity phosphatase PhoE